MRELDLREEQERRKVTTHRTETAVRPTDQPTDRDLTTDRHYRTDHYSLTLPFTMSFRFLQRFASKTRLVASDSWNLTSILVKARPTSIPSTRAALMQCARSDGNVVAESALRLDREIGLMRYHGLGGYLTAKGGVRALLPSGSSGGGFDLTRFLFGPPSGKGREARASSPDTGHGISTSDSTTSSSSPKKARVAFMITAAQRQQLSTELGYTAEDIRRLKPLEALLILEHCIKPGSDEEVMRLVKENEEMERQEAERAEMEIVASAIVSEEATRAAPAAADTKGKTATDKGDATLALAAGQNTNQDEPSSQQDQNDDAGTSLSSSISDQSAAVQQALSRPLRSRDQQAINSNEGDGTSIDTMDESDVVTWYEVVETRTSDSGDEAVIALYQTVEEAEDCLRWKEERGKGKFSYEIRQRA